MLVELEICPEDTLPVTCFEQVCLLCRANVRSLLNCRLGGVLGKAASDRLGDRSDNALDFTDEEMTECCRHHGWHGRKHYMLITRPARKNGRVLARQDRSQLCAVVLGPQRVCERHESHRHQPTRLRARVLRNGIEFQRLCGLAGRPERNTYGTDRTVCE